MYILDKSMCSSSINTLIFLEKMSFINGSSFFLYLLIVEWSGGLSSSSKYFNLKSYLHDFSIALDEYIPSL